MRLNYRFSTAIGDAMFDCVEDKNMQRSFAWGSGGSAWRHGSASGVFFVMA